MNNEVSKKRTFGLYTVALTGSFSFILGGSLISWLSYSQYGTLPKPISTILCGTQNKEAFKDRQNEIAQLHRTFELDHQKLMQFTGLFSKAEMKESHKKTYTKLLENSVISQTSLTDSVAKYNDLVDESNKRHCTAPSSQ